MPMKGALGAAQAARAMSLGLTQGLGPGWRVQTLALADGGEGTVAAFLSQPGFVARRFTVTGPLGQPVRAVWAWCEKHRLAVMEMSSAAGIWRLQEHEKNPLCTTTFGVGELLLKIRSAGAKEVVVGLGGSTTVDGGLGMAQALGFGLTDTQGNPLCRNNPATGQTLLSLKTIAPPAVFPLQGLRVTALCDVASPLTGPKGAARMFGPQKGASPDTVKALEKGLKNLEKMVARQFGVPVGLPGGGAAGGLGAGLAAFAGASLKSGAAEIARLLQLEKAVAKSRLVLAAEGALDAQTAQGKGIGVLTDLCQRHHVPLVVLAGRLGEGHEDLFARGLSAAFAVQDGPLSVAESMARTAELLERRALHVGRLVKEMNKR